MGCNANRGRASIRSPARPSVIRNHRQTLSRLFRRPANTFQGEYERVSVAWRFSGKGTVDSNIFSTSKAHRLRPRPRACRAIHLSRAISPGLVKVRRFPLPTRRGLMSKRGYRLRMQSWIEALANQDRSFPDQLSALTYAPSAMRN